MKTHIYTPALVRSVLIATALFLCALSAQAATTVSTTCSVVVNAPTITCNLSSNPNPLIGGTNATFTWSSTGADTCTGSGFNTAGGTNGTSASVSIVPGNIYQVQCTASNGASPCTKQITALSPRAFIEAVPDRVNTGSTATVRWSADQVSTCTVTKDGTQVWTTTLTLPTVSIATTTLSPAPTITKQTLFAISCDGAAASDTVLVNVNPGFEEF